MVTAAKAGLWQDELSSQYPRVDEIPFSSERKWMTTVHTVSQGRLAYSKGALEVILDSCPRIYRDGQETEISDRDREHILEIARQWADAALRVLGMAYKPLPDIYSAADASEQHGLALPEFSPETVAKLRTIIKRDIRLNNPLDLTGSVTAEQFEGALKIMANDQDIDVVLALFIPAAVVDTKTVEDAIRRVIPVFQRHKKPLLTCFMGQKGFKAKLGATGKFVPCYPFPENAVSALAKAVEYRELMKRPRSTVPRIRGIKRVRARQVIETAMSPGTPRPLWLSAKEIAKLIDCDGIRTVETLVASTATEAAALASMIGFPVAVKLNSSLIIHKTDVGGVMLDLRSADEVISAFNTIWSSLAASGREHEMKGVTVQPIAELDFNPVKVMPQGEGYWVVDARISVR